MAKRKKMGNNEDVKRLKQEVRKKRSPKIRYVASKADKYKNADILKKLDEDIRGGPLTQRKKRRKSIYR